MLRNKLFYLLNLIIFLFFITNCSKNTPMENENNNYDDELTLSNEVAREFYKYDFKWGDKIEKNNLSKVNTIGGYIIDEREIRLGDQPTGPEEVHGYVPGGYVITGIGARVKNDNFTTLWLEGRYVYADGSLGTRYRWKFGSEPNHAIEFWYAVPTNAVMYGFGGRVKKDNLYTAHIHYRYINSSRRLYGAVYTYKTSNDPNGPIEVEYMPHENGLDMDRAVITELGLRSQYDNLRTMCIIAGYLN